MTVFATHPVSGHKTQANKEMQGEWEGKDQIGIKLALQDA